MIQEVKVPSQGESIVSGILSRWCVANGDSVSKGQILYELETDKITFEGLADAAGRIELMSAEGAEVQIGEVIARIDTSVKVDVKEEKAPAAVASPAPKQPESPKPSSGSEVLAPSVERIAKETGVDPAGVSGSGRGGRVTKGDMLVAVASSRPSPQANPSVSEPVPARRDPGAGRSGTRKKLSPLRKRIAERLVQAQHEAAILTTFNEVDMSGIMRVRAEVQEAFQAAHGVKLGFMSFFVKAVVGALKKVPQLHASIEGDELVSWSRFDIGVAVGTEKGLVVPVLRDCDQLSLAGIEKELARYAKLARDGKLAIADLQGGVFTISNGGVYGSLLSTPIINPPQSGILGMHTIKERPVAVDGQVVIRPMMYLALSYDHRIVDGKEAVGFLIAIKDALEHPSRLIMEL
ncbi:MAG: 2-oxoglutarate dehydrogenase complex dihydrolipoyllysine-residue succinyltransferase [Opitutales bacterium]|nr:2-oxoglutarate dehydrogenase complex dihydrolipoyllysine-residue succinyltransferase [Opitutales bacterium]